MNKLSWLAVVVCLLGPALARGQSPVPYQTDFTPEEFKARWEKAFKRLGEGSVAIVQGMPKVNGFILPRQTNEFYYLCGVETPHSYIVLDGKTKKVTLYLPPRDFRTESAEGRILSFDDAEIVKKLIGVDAVQETRAT